MSKPETLYKDKDLLVVNKPSGLLVHPLVRLKVKGGRLQVTEPTLVDWLLKHYPEVKGVGDDPMNAVPRQAQDLRPFARAQDLRPSAQAQDLRPFARTQDLRPFARAQDLRPGIVHRLDRDTSGAMVIARNQKTFLYLKSLFQKHEVKKTYHALVWGVPKEKTGTITKPIGIRNGSVKRSVHGGRMIKDAVTDYKVVRTYGAPSLVTTSSIAKASEDTLAGKGERAVSLLEISPRTGRTHQIRVHLASIGHPILGDPLYGKKREPFHSPRLMLHASAIEFAKRDGTRLRVDAAPPRDFLDYEKAIGT